MSTSSFLRAIINAAEKAANVARACRHEKELFKLLVQEKSEDEKNQSKLQDFKTLADVLIQETIKYDLGKKFPEIANHIKGEESNKFTNTLGESVYIRILEHEAETSDLLCKVLDGDKQAADILAKEVHRVVDVKDTLSNLNLTAELPIESLGIWIDPIDSTAEYIQGESFEPEENGIYLGGLQCVTVLIGAYKQTTGEPVLGVINQPFYELDEGTNSWKGRHFWGISLDGETTFSLSPTSRTKEIALLSSSESDHLKKHLASKYQVIEVAGAGYKQLCIALGLADFYILSRGSTYRWDCCAPHAVLKSLGGGIVSYKQFMSLQQVPSTIDLQSSLQIKYDKAGESGWCNNEGILAYSSQSNLKDLFSFLKTAHFNH